MDIDIDVGDNEAVRKLFNVTRASMVQNDELIPHLVGVYFQNIPIDPITKLAAVPYKQAEELGYMKIDFLNINLLKYFTDKKQIRGLLKKDPDWSLMQDRQVCEKLFQLHNHYDLVRKVKPKSIDDIADCIALIRPAKRHLIDQYINNPCKVRKQLYDVTSEDKKKGSYRKSHAIAYAHNIVLQLHLIEAGIYEDD